MVSVTVLLSRKFRAREKICPALVAGIRKVGDQCKQIWADDYREPVGDVALFYGLDGARGTGLDRALREYRAAGKQAIYLDLPYFNNRSDGRYAWHRWSMNARHPTAYFQKRKHPPDRFLVHKRGIAPWGQTGDHVIVCGMSEKAANYEGYDLEQWERAAIKRLQAVTDRPIVYRPKPQRRVRKGYPNPQYPPIEGVAYSNPLSRTLNDELQHAWAVVSHHSNCGVDALLAGIPQFSDEGVASVLGHSDLAKIESPFVPSDEQRRQFAADVAYCQWNHIEARDGIAWRHFKDEGLVP